MNIAILLLSSSFFLIVLLLVLVLALIMKSPSEPHISKKRQRQDMQRIREQIESAED